MKIVSYILLLFFLHPPLSFGHSDDEIKSYVRSFIDKDADGNSSAEKLLVVKFDPSSEIAGFVRTTFRDNYWFEMNSVSRRRIDFFKILIHAGEKGDWIENAILNILIPKTRISFSSIEESVEVVKSVDDPSLHFCLEILRTAKILEKAVKKEFFRAKLYDAVLTLSKKSPAVSAAFRARGHYSFVLTDLNRIREEHNRSTQNNPNAHNYMLALSKIIAKFEELETITASPALPNTDLLERHAPNVEKAYRDILVNSESAHKDREYAARELTRASVLESATVKALADFVNSLDKESAATSSLINFLRTYIIRAIHKDVDLGRLFACFTIFQSTAETIE